MGGPVPAPVPGPASWRASRPVEVPANASRFMPTRDQALGQDLAAVRLAWSDDDPYVFNQDFDDALIAHDDSYCTSVVDLDQVVQVPTAAYFEREVLPHTAGVPVLSVDDALREVPAGTTVLVCNPNHLPSIRERYGDRWRLVLPRDL